MKKFIYVMLVFEFIFVNVSSSNGELSTTTEKTTQTSGNSSSHNADNNSQIDLVEKVIQEVEHGVSDLSQTLQKYLLPLALKVGFKSNASLSCLLSLASVVKGVQKFEAWAFKMLDATGKPSGSLLEGTSTALGDYDECLDVVSPSSYPIRGAYCLVEIKPPPLIVQTMKDYQDNKFKANHTLANTKSFLGFLHKVRTNPENVVYRLGVCLPSRCYANDLESIIDIVTEDVDLDVPIDVVRCEKKKPLVIEFHHIVILTLIVIILVLVIVASIITVLQCNNRIAPSSPSRPIDAGCRRRAYLKGIEVCSKFSLIQNSQTLHDCSADDDAANVVKGLTVVTVLMTILGHTYALPHPLHMYRFRNTLNFTKFIDELLFGAIANSSVGVDSIFFLGGFHFVYNRWRHQKRPSILRYIAKFIFIIFMRIVAIQVLVGSLFFLTPIFGSGPLWEEFVQKPLTNCRNNWWRNLLFIQNYQYPFDICLQHTWILGTMMQIFIITSALVYIMHRWPFYGVLSNLFTITAGLISVALVTAVCGYPASFTIYFYDYRTALDIWKYLFTQFYAHLGPQCIGMITAFILTEYPSRKIDKRLVLPLWMFCFLTLCSIVFGLHSYRDGQVMDRSLAIFYAAVHRPAWAIAIGWIVYACATGHGGIVRSVLCWKGFLCLERLCYLAFLLHVPLMYYHGGVQRERMYMGHYNQVMCFIAYAVASFALSLVCYLFFQAPYQGVEQLLLGKRGNDIWEEVSQSDSQVTLGSASKGKDESKEEEAKSKVFNNRYEETERF